MLWLIVANKIDAVKKRGMKFVVGLRKYNNFSITDLLVPAIVVPQ